MQISPAISPIPFISISPASPGRTPSETSFPLATDGDDGDQGKGFRPKLLSPRPAPPRPFPRLRSPTSSGAQRGIDRDQFELILHATRARRAALRSPEHPDLHTELTTKPQRNKHLERRARFLAKVRRSPSPRSTNMPKTPPSSPTILHYSLPSPELESPRAVFAAVGCSHSLGQGATKDPGPGWVEQVDFCLPLVTGERASVSHYATAQTRTESTSAPATLAVSMTPTLTPQLAPSLAEITAHLCSTVTDQWMDGHSSRSSPFRDTRQWMNVGRLQMPIRSPSPSDPTAYSWRPTSAGPSTPCLQVKTTVMSRTTTPAVPFPLSEANLRSFNRSHTARDMITTLRRRCSPASLYSERSDMMGSNGWKSAPAELCSVRRTGFESAVLSLPGAF